MYGNKGMEQLIPLVNKLQNAFSSANVPLALDLPQIAVVGSQSAGKSSVLENFVGRDFLPRGSGIVTRRPLVLQLLNDTTEYGVFAHIKNKRFTNFEEIRREIEIETDRLTGSNKGVSNVPINLSIHSPHVLNLTLIDLPGMTKVPVGDQPTDIEVQIRNMILEFIERDNCLILAVTPANSDLANSDSLKLAKQCDPQGLRTIGVLTKLDLMDDGTDAREILENRVLPLRRGYVGVVNRSQRDIDGKKDINSALAAEYRFFIGHPSYHHMADRMGTPYLQQVLNQQLTSHIRESLPELRNRLQAQMAGMEKDIAEYRSLKADDPNYKTTVLLRMVRSFETEFTGIIHGSSSEVETQSLSGGAEIGRVFHERFPYEMLKIQFDEATLRKEIGIAIQNIHGVRPGLFTPDKAFDATVRKLIDKLRPPAMRCVDLVVERLIDVIQLCSEQLARFPCLREEITRLVNLRMRELEVITRDHIHTLINYELAYTNTNHEDFVGFHNAEKKANDSKVNQVICKGWLSLTNPTLLRGGSKFFWFVLTTESLKWYTNDTEQELKYMISLEGLKQRSSESSLFSKKHVFRLYHSDPKSAVYKDYKTLDLSAETQEASEAWKAALVRVGVYPQKTKTDEPSDTEQPEQNDPRLERQVEVIRNLVDSYMKIVNKTQRDLVPKVIMHELINQIKSYMSIELLPAVYTQDADRLMQESDTERHHREEVMRMYEAIKQALDIIRDVMSNTQRAPIPPPIVDNWMEAEPATSTATPGRLQPSHQQPQRPVTPPPPATFTASGLFTGASRPVPTRPAPNLPVRANHPASFSTQPILPTVPNRLGLANGAHVPQSASTGNLPGIGSSIGGGGGSGGGSSGVLTLNTTNSTAVWRNFDPLSNQTSLQPPAPPPKVASLGDRLTGSDRSVNFTQFPKVPPRPN